MEFAVVAHDVRHVQVGLGVAAGVLGVALRGELQAAAKALVVDGACNAGIVVGDLLLILQSEEVGID